MNPPPRYAESRRNYYLANKERLIIKQRAYYQNNKERIRIYNKEYRQKHSLPNNSVE
jgi:hypothetical protein